MFSLSMLKPGLVKLWSWKYEIQMDLKCLLTQYSGQKVPKSVAVTDSSLSPVLTEWWFTPMTVFLSVCLFDVCFFALKWYFSNLGLHLHKGGGLTADRLKKEWLKSKQLRLRCPDFYFLVGGSWKCLDTSGLYHRLSGLNLTRLLQGDRRHYSTLRLSGNFKVTVAEMTLRLDKKINKKKMKNP